MQTLAGKRLGLQLRFLSALCFVSNYLLSGEILVQRHQLSVVTGVKRHPRNLVRRLFAYTHPKLLDYHVQAMGSCSVRHSSYYSAPSSNLLLLQADPYGILTAFFIVVHFGIWYNIFGVNYLRGVVGWDLKARGTRKLLAPS